MADFPDIPGYHIRRRIGSGGMGAVYLAEQTSLTRRVALKVMLASLVEQDTRFAERFKREALTTARLRHPNVITVYDSGEVNGRCYIAMDFIEGGALRERIDEGTLTAKQILRITYGIASGLRHAHEAGLVHRDIKPANILLDSTGNPVITDFGIVKVTASNTELTGTSTVGSPTYMSPEQLLGARDIDGRADLYSLGVVLFEMLEGRPPFRSDASYAVGMKHLNEEPPLLAPRNRRFQSIVSGLLEKNPDERFESAAELMKALRKMRGGAWSAAGPAKVEAPAPSTAGSDNEPTVQRDRTANGRKTVVRPVVNRQWDPDRIADPPDLTPRVAPRLHKSQLREEDGAPFRSDGTTGSSAPWHRRLLASTAARLVVIVLGIWIAWAVFLPGIQIGTLHLELRGLFGSAAEKSRVAMRFTSLGKPERSAYWMEQAARAGHPGGFYEVGLRYRQRDEARAIEAFESELANPITDAWDQPASLMLGDLLCNGRGVENCARARSVLRQAATEYGDQRAMVKIGEIYLNRLDPPDPAAAIAWFERVLGSDPGKVPETAAERDAMLMLSKVYDDGLGVDPDPEAAVQWLALAAQSRYADRVTVRAATRRCAEANPRPPACRAL